MRLIRIVALMLILPGLAQAQSGYNLQPEPGLKGPERLFGVWGTSAQCAAYRSGRYGNPSLYPYQISQEWIRQGLVYCYMQWRNRSDIASGIQAIADAQCGEDTIRDYRVVLELQAQILRIHWSADFSTDALQSCQ